MTLKQEIRNGIDELDLSIMDVVNDDELFDALLMLVTVPASPIEVLDVLRGMEQDVTELERMYNL